MVSDLLLTVIQPSIGIITAALQLQRGGINLSNKNNISNPISSDCPMANPPSVPELLKELEVIKGSL